MGIGNALNEAKKVADDAIKKLGIFEEASRIEADSKKAESLLQSKLNELRKVSDEVDGLIEKRDSKKKAMLNLDARVDEGNVKLANITKDIKAGETKLAKIEDVIKKTLVEIQKR
jgi:chromosome segregation ATPase